MAFNKVALLYNPVAGGGRFRYKLDAVIALLQKEGLQVVPWRITTNQEIYPYLQTLHPAEYHTVVAAGGDGTIHGVINALMDAGFNIPLAIFPEGTSNDVAAFLNLPNQVDEYCRVISQGCVKTIDLGKVNQDYFINVASAGLLTETAHQVGFRLKNLLGRSAYFLKTLEKLPYIQPLHLKVIVDGDCHEMEAIMLVILNGGTAGGFSGLAPNGEMSDGLLDFLAIKPVSLSQAASLLYNYFRGQLHADDTVFCCQGRCFQLDMQPSTSTDLDGEKGPGLPWEVCICPQVLQLRLPAPAGI